MAAFDTIYGFSENLRGIFGHTIPRVPMHLKVLPDTYMGYLYVTIRLDIEILEFRMPLGVLFLTLIRKGPDKGRAPIITRIKEEWPYSLPGNILNPFRPLEYPESLRITRPRDSARWASAR